MKYKEFREYLKGTDFELIEDDVLIQVNTGGLGCVKIAKNTHRQIILPFAVEEPEEFELIKKSLDLAQTPLDEREEEKKYYLKHRFISNLRAEKYINLSITGTVAIRDHSFCGNQNNKRVFTKTEIEKLKEEFNTDFNDFRLVEVEV